MRGFLDVTYYRVSEQNRAEQSRTEQNKSVQSRELHTLPTTITIAITITTMLLQIPWDTPIWHLHSTLAVFVTVGLSLSLLLL